MAISIYDACLLFKLRDVIEQTERNPIGLWLIQCCGSVWLFIVLKVIGTLVVGTILRVLYQRHSPLGLTVTLVLALLQGILLVYLNM